MKNFILKFYLEIYALFVFIVAAAGFSGIYELTANRKKLLLIIVIGVFHEYEEKKFPGGFFENLGIVWGWNMETVDIRKPGQWVVLAWLVIAFIPYIFDNIVGLLLAPVFLGIFEMIIHTAGKKICNISGWYVPGIVTAWAMGVASVYSICLLVGQHIITSADCIIGILCVAFVMAALQILVQKSADYSVPKMIAHMKSHQKK